MINADVDTTVPRGAIGPLYYIYGNEPYLVEREVKGILDRAVTPEVRDFNYSVYYGNEVQADEIVATAQTFPMFAERRVILVKRANELSAASMEALASYVAHPLATTCLVFQGGEKIDQRKKFFTELKKTGKIVECKRLYENQVPAFIGEESKLRGKRIEPAAAALLAGMVGTNLQELVSQLEKLVTYVGARESIRSEDVRAAASDTRVDSVFDMANAIGEKDLEKALRSLQTLMRDGEAPLMVLSMLTRHFRQIWLVRDLAERKVVPQEIGRQTGIHPYFLKGIMAQARNYRISDLQRLFERMYGVDLAIKSGGGNPALLLERLVMETCGNGQMRREDGARN